MTAKLFTSLTTVAVLALTTVASGQQPKFASIFNGKDLTGWKIPAGDNGHWKVVDGVVDYDAASEATGDKASVVGKILWRFHPARGLAHQGNALHEPERLHHSPRRHSQEGRQRERHPHSRARLRLGNLPSRRRQVPGQHLELADRFGRGLRLSHRPEDAAGGARGRHAVQDTPIATSASGTPSKSRCAEAG